ncbi:MAG: F0F1 ATP synthase subunit A [Ktedonobacteraceae bacterium]|nr:F0F1 ATP synthase subunit A [Ktedonobacteraceae bacterium]
MFWKLPVVKLAPDVIFHIGAFPVTNTLLCTWIVTIVLAALFFSATRRRDLIPSGLQNLMEWVVEFLLGLVENVTGKDEQGKRRAKTFFPLVATLFIFILLANLIDVFPGVDTLGAVDTAVLAQMHMTSAYGPFLFGAISNAVIPWVRPATTDLNLTFAMALVTVVTSQVVGFSTLGPGEHLSKYFNFRSLFKFNFEGFIEFFVGLLDIVSELARVISLAFRLFGNIFAGSVVLAVFAFLLPFLADVVFIPFEIFVAFVQALIFSLLTLVFLQMATIGHAPEPESEQEARAEFSEKHAVVH